MVMKHPQRKLTTPENTEQDTVAPGKRFAQRSEAGTAVISHMVHRRKLRHRGSSKLPKVTELLRGVT